MEQEIVKDALELEKNRVLKQMLIVYVAMVQVFAKVVAEVVGSNL